MWNKLMIVAFVCAGIQWILFSLNLAITGHFNWIVFPQAILWTGWGLFCLTKKNLE